MALYYLDTSAAFKLLAAEEHAEAFLAFYREHRSDSWISSDLLRIEVSRAVTRNWPALIPDAQRLLDAFEYVQIDEDVVRSAIVEPDRLLRSLDAIHLATARILGPELTALLTYDDRLAKAAADAGISVLAPVLPDPRTAGLDPAGIEFLAQFGQEPDDLLAAEREIASSAHTDTRESCSTSKSYLILSRWALSRRRSRISLRLKMRAEARSRVRSITAQWSPAIAWLSRLWQSCLVEPIHQRWPFRVPRPKFAYPRGERRDVVLPLRDHVQVAQELCGLVISFGCSSSEVR